MIGGRDFYMNYTELERHVNSKQLKSIYLFWGEEEYLMYYRKKKEEENA